MRIAEVDLLEVGGALGGVALGHLRLVRRDRRHLLVGALAVDEELSFRGCRRGRSRSFAWPSSVLKRFWRACSSGKSTRWPSKSGPVDAGEFHLPADRDAARAAHAGAVDHDGVERHHGLDAEGARGLDAGVHHRQGADGDHQIGLVLLEDLLAKRAVTKPGLP